MKPSDAPMEAGVLQMLTDAKFRQWDINGDGIIDRFELRTCLGAQGVEEEVADEAFVAMDLNEDSGVDPEEFAEWFRSAPLWALVELKVVASKLGDGSAWGVAFRGFAHVESPAAADTAPAFVSTGEDGYLELTPRVPLRGCFTICCWLRRPHPTADVDYVLLAGEGSCLLAVDGGGRVGVSPGASPPAFGEAAACLPGAWTFVAVLGGAGWIRVSAATADHPVPRELVAAPAGTADLSLSSIGRTQSRVHVSELVVFSRQLSPQQVCGVFEASAGSHGLTPGIPQLHPAAVQGRVTCRRVPLAGVTVSGDGALDSATTDDAGLFSLVPREGAAGVGALACRKPGYVTCRLRPGDVAAGAGEVRMQRVAGRARFRAGDGGTLTDPQTGSSVTVQPLSLCYADGRPLEDSFVVELAVIDASDPAALEAMPGDFSARLSDGSNALLQSLGAVCLRVEDDEGTELSCKRGRGMTLRMQSGPLDFDLSRVLSPPGVYEFNSAESIWEQTDLELEIDGEPVDGSSTSALLGEEDEGDLCVWSKEKFQEVLKRGAELKVAGVERSGWWNCDAPYRAALLSGQFSDPGAYAGAAVWSVGLDYQGRARSFVAEDGSLSVMAQCRSEVRLEIGLLFGAALQDHRRALVEIQWLQEKGDLNDQEQERSRQLRADLKRTSTACVRSLGSFTTGDAGEVQCLGELAPEDAA